ncbi:hypothetical protein BST14_00670 [Mycobacterium arosiense ATCC BAA-1401 = DSM 45069]|uniref:Uncharacterized protein n=1 Tax=Mycobacterium arosiense ATCC BAA-1401 = DSM 45069 TaxID=1265311 RepID=A0A1W9ZTA4_MYCAI|nr:hypothetical protein BST14_00670 [Mycobacterium arosiense ATCC BAA-1401 = DSM 45069]
MIGPLEPDQQRGDVLEDAAYVLGRTDGSVPVLFGHHLAVPPSSLERPTTKGRVENRVNGPT